MNVEIVGGPKDGTIIVVPDGMRELVFPILNEELTQFEEHDLGRPVAVMHMALPIERRRGDIPVVRWRHR